MAGRTATVVGGGIAGLAAGAALAHAGWRTRVLDRAPVFGEVGAGVAIPRNGVTALRRLGVDDDMLASIGHRASATGFRDLHGRWILPIPQDDPAVAETVMIWGMHRARLHTALHRLAADAGAEIVTGAAVTHVDPGAADGREAAVTWRGSDGEHTDAADLVVGADGMWSAVRSAVFPGVRPRYSGSTSWRAVVDDSTSDGRLAELWGPSAEFGAMRVGAGEIYWYGYVRHAEGAVFGDELAAARERFAGWAPGVARLINRTDPARLLRHDVYHLPGGLPRYTSGRVVMVGDAAHAALPTMGQGAATALEDGASLGVLVAAPVAAGRPLGEALAAFDGARRPRCRAIAQQAQTMARLGADVPGGWRQAVRNAAFRLVPGGLLARAGAPLVAWTPDAA